MINSQPTLGDSNYLMQGSPSSFETIGECQLAPFQREFDSPLFLIPV